MSILPGVHPPWCPSSLMSVLPGVRPPWCPSSLVSVLPGVRPPWCPSSLVSVLPGVHPPWCPSPLVSTSYYYCSIFIRYLGHYSIPAYVDSISSLYISAITLLFNFKVGVNSPLESVHSFSSKTNFFIPCTLAT